PPCTAGAWRLRWPSAARFLPSGFVAAHSTSADAAPRSADSCRRSIPARYREKRGRFALDFTITWGYDSRALGAINLEGWRRNKPTPRVVYPKGARGPRRTTPESP